MRTGQARRAAGAAALFVLLTGTPWSAAAANVSWFDQVGTAADESHPAVARDLEGNSFVAFATGGTFPGQVSGGGTDVVVEKRTPDGVVAWRKQIADPGDALPCLVILTKGFFDTDPSKVSHVIVAGSTRSPSDWRSDAFVMALDGDGNSLWTRVLGGNQTSEHAHTGFVDLAGTTHLFGPNDGGELQYWRVDINGTLLAEHTFGTTGFDEPKAALGLGANTFVLAYETDGPTPGLPSYGSTDMVFQVMDYDMRVLRRARLGSPGRDYLNAMARLTAGFPGLGRLWFGGSSDGRAPSAYGFQAVRGWVDLTTMGWQVWWHGGLGGEAVSGIVPLGEDRAVEALSSSSNAQGNAQSHWDVHVTEFDGSTTVTDTILATPSDEFVSAFSVSDFDGLDLLSVPGPPPLIRQATLVGVTRGSFAGETSFGGLDIWGAEFNWASEPAP